MSIIGLAVGLFVAAALFPDALTSLTNATYTGVPAAVKTVATTVVGICAAIALVMILLRASGRR